MNIGANSRSPSGASIFVAPAGRQYVLHAPKNKYYRPAGATHIAAPLGLGTGFVRHFGYIYGRSAGASNIRAPLGLLLNRLIHPPRQMNVPRGFELLNFVVVSSIV
jgi:hypothetical protein